MSVDLASLVATLSALSQQVAALQAAPAAPALTEKQQKAAALRAQLAELEGATESSSPATATTPTSKPAIEMNWPQRGQYGSHMTTPEQRSNFAETYGNASVKLALIVDDGKTVKQHILCTASENDLFGSVHRTVHGNAGFYFHGSNAIPVALETPNGHYTLKMPSKAQMAISLHEFTEHAANQVTIGTNGKPRRKVKK